MAKLKATLAKYNVAHKLYKRSLLNTVCIVAGISIFFFGYDQGLMGGVNTTRNYAELMGFGHWDEAQQIVVVDKPLLQGGIVSPPNVQLRSCERETQATNAQQVAVYYLPGTLVGCLIGGWLGDEYGRIATMGIACLWCVFAAALQSAAQNANWMFCGMFFYSYGLSAMFPFFSPFSSSFWRGV